MTEAAWNALCDALSEELELLDALRTHADAGASLMMAMDVPGIERWAQEQDRILSALADQNRCRASALQACLPAEVQVTSQGMVGRMSLLAIIQVAPQWVARRLRTVRARLRELRDEIALITSRNEILVRQALMFTEDLGRSLASTQQPSSAYDARGRSASEAAGSGELLELSV